MSEKNEKDLKLDALAATKLLENVFEECDVEPNTVPMEALSAYSGYRKERFFLQRLILVIAIVLFLMLPFLFISPDYKVSEADTGERNLPVYSVSVNNVLPVGYVTARLDGDPIPVYEADSHTFTVEPTRNGSLELEVSLFNAQKTKKTVTVKGIDENAPLVLSSVSEGGKLKLYVKDEDSGINYSEVYAVDSGGKTVKPVSYKGSKGEIVFDYPQTDWDVYIPDMTGNTLHLRITKQ